MSSSPQSISYVVKQTRTNQSGTATFGGNTVTRSWINTLSGESNPGWKYRLSKGLATVGGYSAEKRTISLGDNRCESRYRGSSSVFSNWTFEGLPSAPSFSTSGPTTQEKQQADNEARAEFYNNVRQVFAEFQAIVAAGEAKQTFDLVAGNLRDVHTLLRLTKHEMLALIRNGARRKDLLRRLRSRYLECVFGITPLMADIDNFMSALDSNQGASQTCVGSATKRSSATSTINVNGFSNSQCPLTQSSLEAYAYSVKYTAKLILGEPTRGKYEPPRGFGTTLQDFVPSIYNLIPYSFIADYVSNLGSVITAHSYQNIGQQYAYVNTKLITSRSMNWLPWINSNVDSMSGGFSYQANVEKTTRGRIPVVPLPSLSIRTPSVKQVLNVIALFSKPF